MLLNNTVAGMHGSQTITIWLNARLYMWLCVRIVSVWIGGMRIVCSYLIFHLVQNELFPLRNYLLPTFLRRFSHLVNVLERELFAHESLFFFSPIFPILVFYFRSFIWCAVLYHRCLCLIRQNGLTTIFHGYHFPMEISSYDGIIVYNIYFTYLAYTLYRIFRELHFGIALENARQQKDYEWNTRNIFAICVAVEE